MENTIRERFTSLGGEEIWGFFRTWEILGRVPDLVLYGGYRDVYEFLRKLREGFSIELLWSCSAGWTNIYYREKG